MQVDKPEHKSKGGIMKGINAIAVFIILVAAAVPVAAANMIVNPNIAGSLSPWTGLGVFDAGNSNTADGSGSFLASLTNASGTNNSIGAGTHQCVAGITAGTSYSFGGFASLEPSSPGTQGGAVINTQWFSDNACGTFITQTGTFGPTTQDTPLHTYVPITHVQVAPAGAHSVLVVASVLNNQAGPSTFTARFDDFFFDVATSVQAPLVQVPALDMPGVLALGAALALAALWALRRRWR
jgi:hypothetical protein